MIKSEGTTGYFKLNVKYLKNSGKSIEGLRHVKCKRYLSDGS